jgi:adenylate kinase
MVDSLYSKALEERPTDFDPELARQRYKIFQKYFSTLTSLREHFTFTLINAMDTIGNVQKMIVREFEYQSENEIAVETLDIMQVLGNCFVLLLL